MSYQKFIIGGNKVYHYPAIPPREKYKRTRTRYDIVMNWRTYSTTNPEEAWEFCLLFGARVGREEQTTEDYNLQRDWPIDESRAKWYGSQPVAS